MPEPTRLPIHEVAPEILRSVAARRCAVISAPTGSGKTTQIPRLLHESRLIDGKLLVLQPRRLAARVMARRVAQEMGVPLGSLVGYQTRHESLVRQDTVIRFMTEGLFLRLLQSRPELPGVGAVVLDEFHERSLALDTALALLKSLRRTARPDLALLVMSATLEVEKVARYLDCPAVEARGRTYPVELSYLPRRDPRNVWDVAAHALQELVEREELDGDALVFMPGAYEIRRTLAAMHTLAQRHDLALLPLHGQMPPGEQDEALRPRRQRRVIVSTNVAETSITITGDPGVRVVIDSGQARVNRFDPRRGINVLRVEAISQASADQRAGRAGRTAPGRCLRLWPANEHRSRPAQTSPEVRRLDLAEVTLHLAALGVRDLRAFDWIEPPEQPAVGHALRTLHALDAMDEQGVTALGRDLAELPMHPRLGRTLVAAASAGCLPRAALWAAILSDREVVSRDGFRSLASELGKDLPSDMLVLEHAVAFAQRHRYSVQECSSRGVNAAACREAVMTRYLYLDASHRAGLRNASRQASVSDLVRCLLLGFPDHLAVRRGESNLSCVLSGKRRGELVKESAVRHAPLLLPMEIQETSVGTETRTWLSCVSAVERSWLDELFAPRIARRTVTEYDEQLQAAQTLEQTLFDDLTIEERVLHATDKDAAGGLLAELVLAGRLKLQGWDETVEQWIARVRCVAQWFPEKKLITYSDEDLRLITLELCSGAVRYSQIKDRPCLEAVRGALSWDDQQFVERMSPAKIELPGGYRMRIEYSPGNPPRGRAKIQDFYGLQQTPRVAGGRVPVLLEILGPNFRPVQVTEDLAGFWANLYPTLRKELSRKYPRHEWR